MGAATFRRSPQLEQMVEDFYLANCTKGRMGYQGGELSDERKTELRADFIQQLTENEKSPLFWEGWGKTFLPSFFYLWPTSIPQKMAERAERKRIEEEERIAREAEEERLRLEAEEKARIEAEKQAKKEKNAAYVAEKQKAEAEKKAKWLEEAKKEAEEQSSEEEEEELIV